MRTAQECQNFWLPRPLGSLMFVALRCRPARLICCFLIMKPSVPRVFRFVPLYRADKDAGVPKCRLPAGHPLLVGVFNSDKMHPP